MLINCPDCGEKVSNKASACIHYSYPLRSEQNAEKLEPAKTYSIIITGYDKDRIFGAVSGLKQFSVADGDTIRLYLNKIPFVIASGGTCVECTNMQKVLQKSGV